QGITSANRGREGPAPAGIRQRRALLTISLEHETRRNNDRGSSSEYRRGTPHGSGPSSVAQLTRRAPNGCRWLPTRRVSSLDDAGERSVDVDAGLLGEGETRQGLVERRKERRVCFMLCQPLCDPLRFLRGALAGEIASERFPVGGRSGGIGVGRGRQSVLHRL